MRFETLSVHPKGQAEYEESTCAVMPSITLSTTFAQESPGNPFGVKDPQTVLNPLLKLPLDVRILSLR